MDLVNVKNVGTTDLMLRHDGQGNVNIPPGESTILPMDYVNVFFGNPSARNAGKYKDRDDTFSRVRTYWGYFDGLESEDVWLEKKPKVEVTTLQGERVWTVMDDPEGVKGGPSPDTTDLNDPRFAMAAIRDLQGQIERLTSIIATNQGASTPLGDNPSPEAVMERQVAEQFEKILGDQPADDSPELDTGALPEPSDDEEPVSDDKPRTPRSGQRGNK